MGFRNGAYATVWSVEGISDTRTKVRISISKKNKQTGEYETDFSGYVIFAGTAAASKALGLAERDRIKLGEVDVTSKYVKEKNREYVNYAVFSFDIESGGNGNAGRQTAKQMTYDDLVNEDTSFIDEELPF